MDNLTHSLAAAVLGRMGLNRATGRATPVLIIAANLPDIDSWIAPLIGQEPLAFHRGFTHGIGGWIVMPFVAAALVLLWDKWRPARQPVRPWALLLVAAIGMLSHPLLDLMNTYGIRLFEPLSNRWFYGDTLFIIDPWIWIALIVGLELSWRAERLGRDWTKPALAICAAVFAYAAANVAISARAEHLARRDLAEAGIRPTMVIASPAPIQSWRRRVLWRNGEVAGSGFYDPFIADRVSFDRRVVPLNLEPASLAAAAARDPDVRAFLFWSRMPMVVRLDGRRYLTDQRFFGRPRRRRGAFVVPLDSKS